MKKYYFVLPVNKTWTDEAVGKAMRSEEAISNKEDALKQATDMCTRYGVPFMVVSVDIIVSPSFTIKQLES